MFVGRNIVLRRALTASNVDRIDFTEETGDRCVHEKVNTDQFQTPASGNVHRGGRIERIEEVTVVAKN